MSEQTTSPRLVQSHRTAEDSAASTRKWQILEAYRRFLACEIEKRETNTEGWTESTPVPEQDDLVGLMMMARRTREFRASHLGSSYSAEPGDAMRDEDEENPGRIKITFRTREGQEQTYRNLPCYASESLRGRRRTNPSEGPSPAFSIANESLDDRLVVEDDQTAPPERLAALGRLLDSPRQEEAIADLLSELARPDARPERRDALVFAAENVHFPPHLRGIASDHLLAIASTQRSGFEDREKVVWSALRRGASLLTPNQVERILPFLENGSVDTRAVALQSIARMFEPRPPDTIPLKVADRVLQFARKFLDPDVFTAGDPSLIARNAVSALATMADPRLNSVTESVRALSRGFLTRRIYQELNRIRSGWLARGVARDHPAVTNIDGGLALLN